MQKTLHSATAATVGLIVLTTGLGVLCSWWLGLSPLYELHPSWIVMKANTALAFFLIGLSLYLRTGSHSPPAACPKNVISRACAASVFLLGSLSFFQYLSGFDLGLDQFLAQELPGMPATSHPGRMAPTTALCFTLAAIPLLAPDRPSWQAGCQLLALMSGLLGLLFLIGFLYSAELLPHYTRIAFHTALLFLILSIGTFCLYPATGPASLFVSDSTGGIMIRRFLPAILAIPLAIGLLRLHADLPDWFGTRENVTMSAFFNIVLLGALAWITAEQLHRLDLKRKQTGDHLQESLREVNDLKAALDEHGIVAVTDPSGKITYVNDKFCAISGYTARELIGQDHRIINSGHHSKAFIRDLWTTITQGKVWKGEIKNKAKDGSYYWVDTTIVPFLNEQGKPRHYVAIRADITARKVAQEKILQLNTELEERVARRTSELESANKELLHSRAELKSIFESLPGLYLVLTSELEIVSASDAYLKATMTTREQILGRNLFEVFPDNPDDAAATGVSNLRASINRVLQSSQPDTMAIQKYDVRRADGMFEERYWSPINSPVLGADHQIKYLIHRVEEVTEFMRQKSRSPDGPSAVNAHLEQMEAEVFKSSQKLQETNRQLEAANKELESFSYSVSHDLRAPLRAIAGFTEILQKRYGSSLDVQGLNYLGRVIAAANRMSDLIDDLLHLSRVNRAEFKPQPVDLSQLAGEIVSQLEQTHPDRKVEFSLSDNVTTNGDPRLLRIAMENLLGNAWKFTSHKSPARIEFGFINHPDKGPSCFIRDNGAGFDMKYAHKLFGPFQRLHAMNEFPGTGIGLAIVQRIINRHDSSIWVEAESGKGAVFYFTLSNPVKEPQL